MIIWTFAYNTSKHVQPDCKHCLHYIIKLVYIDVQMQQGCDDCGLFAIAAFATLLARGEQLSF